jgi:hypothetical protein
MLTMLIKAGERLRVLEAQVALTQRGRSVVNATVLEGEEVRVSKHELSDSEKQLFAELICGTLAHSPRV